MAAATQDVVRIKLSQPEWPPNEAHTQLQNTAIYQGAVGMLVSGKARPYVAGTAGSTILGVALRQYVAPPSSDAVYPDGDQMIFQRGVFGFQATADAPTEALLNQPVAFADDSTIKATIAANDKTGILRAITEGLYWVEIS